MLYIKNIGKKLDINLFMEPSAEYRGAPFWSWNCKLDKNEIIKQAAIFKQMGFGGFHAHSRSGLDTPYLGEEFNGCIRAAAEAAQAEGLHLYLYDEDRWPSGTAGGKVTKDKRFSARYLLFTVHKSKNPPKIDFDGTLLDGELLLARYSVQALGGRLYGYKRLSESEQARGVVWYAYLKTEKPRSFLNNAPYVNTLDKTAIDRFAEITFGTYRQTVGEHFGTNIKSIFTDEPQVHLYKKHKFIYPYQSVERAWTDDFDATFLKAYGYSILDRLPELFWNFKNENREVRYHYFDHLSERFAHAFSDNIGTLCESLGLSFTGHLMEEPRLSSQTRAVGDAMRQYRGYSIPGIDMLCGRHELTTAKQAQSAVRQYGREAMLSELYGVSRWDNSFANYKLSGDWQAALGVTIRVPHLSHMSMKGFAKRDYPASIFYQSPWYEKFKYLEDHFARINTALTRGKPLTEIAVIHPLESYWLHCGDLLLKTGKRLDKKFSQITELLLLNGFDFDYICEATFPDLTKRGGYPLRVKKMQYKTVIVPNCLSLRTTTIERLYAFQKAGGRVIFIGSIPEYVDGQLSGKAKKLAEMSEHIPFVKDKIIAALEGNRLYGIYENGHIVTDMVCQLREDNGALWLFAARVAKNTVGRAERTKQRSFTLLVKGEWKVSLWNTLNGEIKGVESHTEKGFTAVTVAVYNQDSLLLRFDNTAVPPSVIKPLCSLPIPVADNVRYSLSEPNALLLDRAYYELDDKGYSSAPCELLYLDNKCRKRCGLPLRGGRSSQPWATEKRVAEHTLKLKFIICSKINVKEPYIALEEAEKAKITLNGCIAESKVCGWYVDKAIKKIALPPIAKGKNVLEIAMPFGLNTNVEWCYLLGDFGVKLQCSKAMLTSLPSCLKFGDITKQGLPFYGGKLTYYLSFEGNGKNAEITVNDFCAAVLEVGTDESKTVAFAPYEADLPTKKGETRLSITAYISRQNAFGPIHLKKARTALISPNNYYASRYKTAKRYVLSPAGLMSAPEIKISRE